MVNIDELQQLKDKKIISDAEFEMQKRRLAGKLLQKSDGKATKNGIVYIVLAFFFGAIGIHNFYAKYWKRACVQMFISLLSFYMLYIPLLFTSIWAMLELLFVNKSADGVFFGGNRRIIWLLRGLSVLVLVWAFSSNTMIFQDEDLDLLVEI